MIEEESESKHSEKKTKRFNMDVTCSLLRAGQSDRLHSRVAALWLEGLLYPPPFILSTT